MAETSKALVWDQDSERVYETGISNVALYVKNDAGAYGEGVAWNGITAINESPSGAEPTALYANNKKYVELMSEEEFGATLEAYTYPDEFAACNGESSIAQGVSITQQPRKGFGLVYKTLIGNDVSGNSFGYKLHIVYNGKAKPSERSHATVNESPEAETMSWEISTTKTAVSGKAPTSHIIIDSRTADKTKLATLEKKLYGDTATAPAILTPDEVATIMGTASNG